MTLVRENAAATLERAIQDHQAGRLGAAEAAYRRMLAADPAQPDPLHLLGMIAADRGDAPGGLALIDAAIGLGPHRAAFHNTRAQALLRLGRVAEAEAAYRTAWALRPQSAEIANNLASLLRDRGDAGGAVEWFSRAAALAPGEAGIACSLAVAHAARDTIAASLAAFDTALLLDPGRAETHHRLGDLRHRLGELDAAAQCYRTALKLRPEQAATHNNLGVVLQLQGAMLQARACFEAALRHDPNCADAHFNLGCLLQLDNEQDSARACYDRALAAAALHGPARWARCMVELPILYDTAAQIPMQRARYAAQLRALVDAARDPAVAQALAASVGTSQPFFLPYQGECDRSLQAEYGALLVRLLRRETPPLPDPPAPGEAIRVAIVSGYFCEHTVWHLMLKGWLGHIDRNRFSVRGFHTATTRDSQTALAERLCGESGLHTARDGDTRAAILAFRPHVLLYPEIGMDPAVARLSAERLAPVQCVAWGHPQTTGQETIDMFLSSALMEPADAASHYTERLVALPNLGIHYEPEAHVTEAVTRAELGLRENAVVFWCGQAVYKYLPQHDDALARIAAALDDSQFLFIGFARSRIVTARLRDRLRQAFAARGLDADQHCVLVDPMPQPRFLGTVAASDIVLDSIGWSGGKSTLDILAEDPVIVTHPGPMMRGRHTAAILRRIGITETIAETPDAYVETAIRLARDPAARQALKARMGIAKQDAYGDLSAIRVLEDILTQAWADLRGDPLGAKILDVAERQPRV